MATTTTLLLATAEQIMGNELVVTPVNFQPLGLALDGTTDRLAVTNYFLPGVWVGNLTSDMSGNLVWYAELIRYGFETPAGILHSRAQTVNFGDEGALWITFNGGCNFYGVEELEGGKGWRAIDGFLCHPSPNPNQRIHSAGLRGNDLLTIESSDTHLEHWVMNVNKLIRGTQRFSRLERAPIHPFVYGIGFRTEEDDLIWTITDPRCETQPHGIYVNGGEIVIAGVTGNSIAFLHDGSAIVSQYSNLPEISKPGALVYLPAKMFEGK